MRRMALCAASMLLLGCLAGCSTTPQNSQEQGNPVIKEEISQPLGGSEALGNSEDSSALSAADKEKMFAPYEQYGMTYDAVKDELTYNGNLVRSRAQGTGPHAVGANSSWQTSRDARHPQPS